MLEPRHARDLRCTLYWGLYAQGLQCTFSPVVRYKMLAVVQYSVFALGSAVYRVAGKAAISNALQVYDWSTAL